MAVQIIVTEDAARWIFPGVECPVVDADDYLTSEDYFKLKNVQIVNLCKDYRYLSVGYYCSLLAEARRQRVIPSVKDILNLSSKAMYRLDAVNLDEAVQRAFKKHGESADGRQFELTVMLGQCRYSALGGLARQIFETFPCPVLRVNFKRQDKWDISAIRPVSIHKLKAEEREEFFSALQLYLTKRWRTPKQRPQGRYDLAILHDPADPMPPSNQKALRTFIKEARSLGVNAELIERKDYARLAEYDALFIRDTTRINHYTYRFAKKAESEGMVVIDDPTSILRCTNKVYLAELLRAHRIATPKTVILGKSDLTATQQAIGYPMVLKVPEGAFSQGVFKAENPDQFHEITQRLFKTSELILAQEYLYTEFDWRIGVLNRRPIYACQYFMSAQHWQIVKHDADGRFVEGTAKTWAVAETPKAVVDTAVKAAGLIGDGLYGVDIKQGQQNVYVIEVNDNPNIDNGVEDAYLGDELYRIILQEFVRQLDARK